MAEAPPEDEEVIPPEEPPPPDEPQPENENEPEVAQPDEAEVPIADVAPPAANEQTPEELKRQREYEMYLAMAKSLTLQLPFERDRVIASKWVKTIETSEDTVDEKFNYLKLLCISMFSHRLVGPFKYVPKEGLEELNNITNEDIIHYMVTDGATFDVTPYYVEMSGDLKEYAAYQEIPNFGAHFYYAFSNETILNWHNEKRAIVPKGGINYPILNPPSKPISKSAEAFKKTYSKYAKPEPKDTISPDMLPNLVPELHRRKVLNKDEISRMGTKKLINDKNLCAVNPPANQNKPSSTDGNNKRADDKAAPVKGRPVSCGAKAAVEKGRPASCAIAKSGKS